MDGTVEDAPSTPPPAEISLRSYTSISVNRTFGPDSPYTPPAELPSLSAQVVAVTPPAKAFSSTPGTSPIHPATPSLLVEDDSVYLNTPEGQVEAKTEEESKVVL